MKALLIGIWMAILSLFGIQAQHSGTPATTQQPSHSTAIQPIPQSRLQPCAKKQPGQSCVAVVDGESLHGFCQAVTPSLTVCAVPHTATGTVLLAPALGTTTNLQPIPQSRLAPCQYKQVGERCTAVVEGDTRSGFCQAITASTTVCAVPHKGQTWNTFEPTSTPSSTPG